MRNSSTNWDTWRIVGVVLAGATLMRLLPELISSNLGLLFLVAVGFGGAYWRWQMLGRREEPETKGDVKTLTVEDIQKLKPWMFKNIIGQGTSIQSLLQLLKRNLEMLDSNRHLGSYLLVGPTGTGKTFFAKLLAEGLYGRGSLLYIPMNQSGHCKDSVTDIILKAIKENPERVILLDEIDKAPPPVQASLYQFLENGQLMDPATGEWYHCPMVVIIATTNAGSQDPRIPEEVLKAQYGLLNHVAMNSKMEKALLSRFEGLFWFGPLSPMDTAQVGLMQLMSYYRQHGIEVRFLCAEAVAEIVKDNQHFKDFGVRELIRIVRRKSDPLIFQAKAQGWRAVNISQDQTGAFIAQLPKKDRAA